MKKVELLSKKETSYNSSSGDTYRNTVNLCPEQIKTVSNIFIN